MKTWTHIGRRRSCEDRDRDWGAESISQRMPRIAGNHQKPGDRNEADSS